MKKNEWLFWSISIAFAMGLATACSDDDGSGGKDEQTTADEGYLATCKRPTQVYVEGEALRSKSEAANYLAQSCKIPEYFTTDEFLNATTQEQGIGASCFCYGLDCEYMKYERPEVGGIQAQNEKYYEDRDLQQAMFGCDNVKETHNGAVRTCFRSSEVSGILPSIYFPLGTCALAMSKCNVDIPKNDVKDGDVVNEEKTAEQRKKSRDTICGFATFGDPSMGEGAENTAYEKNVDKFIECPSGDVLVDFVMPIEVTGLNAYADLNIRACFQGCKEDSDCHGFGIYDPVVKKQSGTKCQTVTNSKGEKAGVCFDMATVKGVEDKMQLVHAGEFGKE